MTVKNCVLGTFLSLIVFSSCPVFAASVYFPNPGFNDGSGAWQGIEGMSANWQGQTVRTKPGALRISGIHGAGTGKMGYARSPVLGSSLTVGEKYYLSVWMKVTKLAAVDSEGIATGQAVPAPFVSLEYWNQGTWLTADGGPMYDLRRIGEWQQLCCEFTPTNPHDSISLLLRNNKDSVSWDLNLDAEIFLDDIYLWSDGDPDGGYGQIDGMIQDAETALPLPAEAVLLKDGQQVGKTNCNQEGLFVFPALSPGNYLLQLSCLGYLPSSSELAVPGRGTILTPSFSLTPVKYELKGQALDQNGQGLANALVAVGGLVKTRTQQDGSFRLTDLRYGAQQVTVRLAGYLTAVKEINCSEELLIVESFVLQSSPEQQVSAPRNLQATAPRVGEAVLTWLCPLDDEGQELSDVDYLIYRAASGEKFVAYATLAGKTNLVTWSDKKVVPGGSYTYSVVALGRTNKESAGISASVKILGFSIVKGMVRDQYGAPVAGAVVRVDSDSRVTGADGSFCFQEVLGGSRLISAERTGVGAQEKEILIWDYSRPLIVNFTLGAPDQTVEVGISALEAAPLPFRPQKNARQLRVYYLLDGPAGSAFEVTGEIHNLAGRLVWKSQPQAQATGQQYLDWEGRDLKGSLAASGPYLVTIIAKDQATRSEVRKTKAIMILR